MALRFLRPGFSSSLSFHWITTAVGRLVTGLTLSFHVCLINQLRHIHVNVEFYRPIRMRYRLNNGFDIMKISRSFEYILKEILGGGSRNVAQYRRAPPLNPRLGINNVSYVYREHYTV